jgi:hypothetical protein
MLAKLPDRLLTTVIDLAHRFGQPRHLLRWLIIEASRSPDEIGRAGDFRLVRRLAQGGEAKDDLGKDNELALAERRRGRRLAPEARDRLIGRVPSMKP